MKNYKFEMSGRKLTLTPDSKSVDQKAMFDEFVSSPTYWTLATAFPEFQGVPYADKPKIKMMDINHNKSINEGNNTHLMRFFLKTGNKYYTVVFTVMITGRDLKVQSYSLWNATERDEFHKGIELPADLEYTGVVTPEDIEKVVVWLHNLAYHS